MRAALDTDKYPTGIKVDDVTIAALHLTPDKFHGDWNYAIAEHMAKATTPHPRKAGR